MDSITMRSPDDFHAHLRQRLMLANVLPFSNIYGRVVAMGNLVPRPIITAEDVVRYRNEILSFKPNFQPIMTIMLVNQTTPEMVSKACRAGARVLKLIPCGTSVGSEQGVRLENLKRYYPVLEMARDLEMIFSCHWELDKNPKTGQNISEIEREAAALPYLLDVAIKIQDLKIVVEHITTKTMVEYVDIILPSNVAATITVHHLLLTFDQVMKDSTIINPFNYCKPIAKAETDRQAIINAIISGSPKFFFGSDSAPHSLDKKIGLHPSAGIFTPDKVAMPLLCEIFENAGALDKLENFVSKFGAEFYELLLNQGEITLKKERWIVPNNYQDVVPFMAGKTLQWKIS